MSSFSSEIGAVCCALELADLNTGSAVMETSIQLDESLLRHYEERIFHINPRVAAAMQMPVGAIADDRNLMTEGHPHNSEFLDWLEKSPYYFLKGGKVLDAGGHVGFFTANYSKKHGLADDEQHPIFRLMFPHLINIVEIGRAMNGSRLKQALVSQEALERERPFALLDRAGRLVECSIGFEATLRSRKVLGLRKRTLVAIHARHRKQVERFLESALGTRRLLDPPLPIRLTAPDCPRGLVLRAVPLAPSNDIFDVFRPAALVTLTDLDQPFRVRREELIALFGLTRREADIAALVSEGHTPDRVAYELAISEYTVRQHLKAVFGKMGVSRQAELVQLVTRLG